MHKHPNIRIVSADTRLSLRTRRVFGSPLVAVALLLWACFASTVAVADRVYYRYVNDQGVKVLNATVPPEFVKNGYEVVTITGKVLEVVPPALTDEEKAATAERRKREAELAEWDKSLMRRYSAVEDIEASKERKLKDYDASLAILRGNANNINSQIDQAQAQAADAERAGRAVPQHVLEQIAALQLKLEETNGRIEEREEERQEVAEQFDLDAERFREIKPGS